jgi:hypothetical protein
MGQGEDSAADYCKSSARKKREMMAPLISRPKTAAEVVAGVETLEQFGRAVRDWQHELKHVSSRWELVERFGASPRRLQSSFNGGNIADAYLAGYVCFLADKAGLKRPKWACSGKRIAKKPWFSSADRKRLLVTTPGPLREHNIFTEPENVVMLRVGRPRKTDEERRRVNAVRQYRYRQRVKEKLKELLELRLALTKFNRTLPNR